jgi:Alfin
MVTPGGDEDEDCRRAIPSRPSPHETSNEQVQDSLHGFGSLQSIRRFWSKCARRLRGRERLGVIARASARLRDNMSSHPRTIADIVDNFNRRKEGLRKALTDGALAFRERGHQAQSAAGAGTDDTFDNADQDAFYMECHPDKDNLCLYGASSSNCVSRGCVVFGASGVFAHPQLVRARRQQPMHAAMLTVTTFAAQESQMALGKWICRQRKYRRSCRSHAWVSTSPETAWRRKTGLLW